ncbi:hypothetical protein [Rhodococcus sp. BH4]|uniref:hypothetical protein n=1 Tax=Rhodococcus sp. BH4 TaxID=1807790 RepID=UPI0012EBF981|nr:hypothetical protein [Rhodococcus sp. BH4]
MAEPSAGGKFAISRGLTVRLPDFPAAVPLYKRGRTELLALDFDAKRHGSAQVDADVARVLSWLHECGGRTVTDRSASGGRHVLVPLASDTPLRVEDLRILLVSLKTRLPTLDTAPMLGVSQGCISVPGTRCREGGHRQLDGTLAAAIDAFTLRSERNVVARMVALLGGVGAEHRPSRRTAVASVAASLTLADRIVGSGDERRLHPRYHWTTPVSASVMVFARTGKFDRKRWPTSSEARQSVISNAVLRGASISDIEALLGADDHAGLRQAYARYGSPAAIGTALRRDVDKALTWAASVGEQFRDLTHKTRHTGGYGDEGFRNDLIRRHWLASAQLWVNHEFLGSRQRPVLLAVVQSLAYSSAIAGELVEGVPVVAIGGRSLSHAAGLMSESTVWTALRVLRETPGSPVLRVARGAGQLADRYALTTPAVGSRPGAVALERAHVEPVHPSWSVLGLRGRDVYELILHGQVSAVPEALAAARLGTSAGYAILADLRTAGLITLHRGVLTVGAGTLDDVAASAGLDTVVDERITRHRAERVLWMTWLNIRFSTPSEIDLAGQRPFEVSGWEVPDLDVRDSELMWAATMAAGPPPTDPLLEAIERREHRLNFLSESRHRGRQVQVVAGDRGAELDVPE